MFLKGPLDTTQKALPWCNNKVNIALVGIFLSLSFEKQSLSNGSGKSYEMLFEQYNDVIMGAMVPQITSLTIVYSIVYSGADQGKHQSSASLAFVWGIHIWPANSPHKDPVTRKMFPFDDVIMVSSWG